MSTVGLIMRRELAAYFRSYLGWVIIALFLFFDGILFNAFALGTGEKKSSEVLQQFFFLSSGLVGFASAFISMRVLAEERQTGTIALLLSAPVTDAQIVLGKFLSAFVFLAFAIALTLYMPLLILVHGSVAPAHLVVGYLGLLLLGAACLAVGTFGSAVAPNQLLALVTTAVILGVLWAAWFLAFVTERPLNDLFSYLAIWNKHFPPFRDGVLNARDVLYYLTLAYVFLHAATRVLQTRRWR